ncbi:unnamed protein product [Symbiodinium natans]|uniref:Uncharacterized protein n=1 Tax=Symbiodinium natans TaxID=878477 RepID=A0A812RTP7_9DINO|nr:unnamed protein product [Symbiodinium natans]
MYFFGEPGSRLGKWLGSVTLTAHTPTVVPGYLSEEDFDKVCQKAAEAPVEPPPSERKRRGFFR